MNGIDRGVHPNPGPRSSPPPPPAPGSTTAGWCAILQLSLCIFYWFVSVQRQLIRGEDWRSRFATPAIDAAHNNGSAVRVERRVACCLVVIAAGGAATWSVHIKQVAAPHRADQHELLTDTTICKLKPSTQRALVNAPESLYRKSPLSLIKALIN